MAPRGDHYELSPYNGSYYQVHFNDTPESQNETAVLQGIRDGIISSFPQTGPGVHNELTSSTSVFRKMCDAEVVATLESRGLAPPIRGTNNRKYITESFSKAIDFTNNRLSADQLAKDKIIEFTVGKDRHQIIKASAIPQQGSRHVNPSANVFNMEGIRNQNKTNLGIHPSKMPEFNTNVKDITVHNPRSPWVKNNFLRYLSTHKLKVASVMVSVVVEGAAIALAVYKDGQVVGQHTVTQLGSTVGSVIGAVLCSWIPGIGTLAGGLVGGLIGGLVGSGIGSFICTYLFPRVAPGEGPPPTEYTDCIKGLIYGSPEADFNISGVYGVPEPGVGTHGVYGAPQSDIDINIMGAPSPW